MKTLPVTLIISAVGLAFVVASPAEAAKKHRRHHAGYSAHAMAPGAPVQRGGAIYNGQDYLGTDPDPNIQSYIRRDLGARYGGGM
jgi:hypothetical protein